VAKHTLLQHGPQFLEKPRGSLISTLLLCLGALALAACGDGTDDIRQENSDAGSMGAGGTAGSGGTAGAGGMAGTGGSMNLGWTTERVYTVG